MKKGGVFYKQTIETVPIEGKTVLLRTDFNVPLADDGSISDDFRIKQSLPTIKKLLSLNCKVVIISHLGRPKGVDSSLSLEPVAQRLADLLREPVRFVDKTVGDKVQMAIKRAPKKSVIVLENLRFDKREEQNSDTFAKELAKSSGARYFVQDGFGVVHRAHTSTDAITMQIPSVAGLLLQREYTQITNAMNAPKRPLVVVIGGAKIVDKINTITRFIAVADTIIIGGAMANTFLAYKGNAIGKSIAEKNQTKTLDALYDAARKKVGNTDVDEFIVLPTDVATAKKIDPMQDRHTMPLKSVQSDDIILDMGDKSIERMVAVVKQAKTVIWNGPVGMTTLPNFAHGSARLALALATQPNTTSIIGGGDTADFVLKWDANKGKSFTHVSTGGGASIELMAGDALPGIESLLDAK